MIASYPLGFYVYRLRDPRNEVVFYVGKGQRGRAWQHQKDVSAGLAGANAGKISKIKDILAFGLDVIVEIVAAYDSEVDALDHEFRLVEADPTLTNVMPGGAGKIISPLLLEKQRQARLRRWQQERVEAVQRDREREAAKARRNHDRMLADPRFAAHKGKVADWLATLDQRRADHLAAKASPSRGRGKKRRHQGPIGIGLQRKLGL